MTDRTAAKRVAALRQRERDAGMVRVCVVIPKDRKAELIEITQRWRDEASQNPENLE